MGEIGCHQLALFATARRKRTSVTTPPQPEISGGIVAKVVSTSDDNKTFYLRFQNGAFTTFAAHEPLPYQPDDVVLVFEKFLLPAPDHLYARNDSVGVVRQILPNGEVLIERSIAIDRLPAPSNIDLEAGNTIAYSVVDGVDSILSENPIGIRDFNVNESDPVAPYRIDVKDSNLNFDDFGGYKDVVARARELIETSLNKRAQLNQIGARPIKGVIFTGPPGTGKTLLARIVAAQSNAEFFLISGPTIVSKWVGDSEETLRRIFDSAASFERAIIFVDEIDSLAEKRSNDTHEASKRLVAQLLTLMDGFDTGSGNIIVIAATNRIGEVDEALRRPGRFDWEIQFGLPDAQDRFEILATSMKNLSISGDMPLEEIAQLTDGWSAASLSSVWTEAALLAAGDSRGSICDEDFVLAFKRVRDRMPVRS